LKCSFSHPDYTVGLGFTPSPPVIEGSVRTISIQTGRGLTSRLESTCKITAGREFRPALKEIMQFFLFPFVTFSALEWLYSRV
jgi:hypothetical protein